MQSNYNSLEELYKELLPVLKTKVNELKLKKIDYIKEIDIWNYHTKKWVKSNNLTFFDMVSDILNTNDLKYIEYMKDVLKGE